jgi:hypothetical protein
MPMYQVRTAGFDIEADSPKEAAAQVAQMLGSGYASRAVYTVEGEEGEEVELDLEKLLLIDEIKN